MVCFPCHVRHLGCPADASCVVVLSPVILAAMILMTWLGKLILWVILCRST